MVYTTSILSALNPLLLTLWPCTTGHFFNSTPTLTFLNNIAVKLLNETENNWE